MKFLAIPVLIIIGFFGGIIPTANAYSIYSTTVNQFGTFSIASGFAQLATPFESFWANVQSDTLGVMAANQTELAPSTTLPFVSADAQNYLSQLSDWFYGTIGFQILDSANWVKAKLGWAPGGS